MFTRLFVFALIVFVAQPALSNLEYGPRLPHDRQIEEVEAPRIDKLAGLGQITHDRNYEFTNSDKIRA